MKKITNKFKLINNNKMAIRILRKSLKHNHTHCPHCMAEKHIIKHSKDRRGVFRMKCTWCHKTFCEFYGTIFTKTKIPFWKWLYGIILLLESTGSISASSLSKNIEISYPSAWKMLFKIREMLEEKQFGIHLKGWIESDEAWFSHKQNQQIMLGMVERYGKVKFFPIHDTKEDQLLFPHYWWVERNSVICTDSHASYGGLSSRFIHHWLNKSAGEYKRNHVWTGTIEGVWSMLKGIIRTIHHGIKTKYIRFYSALFAFRYNNRSKPINDQFNLLLQYLCQPRYCLY